MFTNTYLPHLGGVARSVSTYEEEFRRRGHDVRVIAPEFEGAEESEYVLRVPAIQHFNGSDFSVQLPQPGLIADYFDQFQPQLIHSHHPFLPGNANEATFAEAIQEMTHDRAALARRGEISRQSLRTFGLDVCADRILELYEQLVKEHAQREDADPGPWDRLLGRLEIEWNLLVEKTSALAAAVVKTDATRSQLD